MNFELKFLNFQIFSGSQLLSDFQTFFVWNFGWPAVWLIDLSDVNKINNRKHLVYFYSNKGLVICYNSLYWIISWYKYYLSNSNIFLMRVPAVHSTIVIFSFDLLIELAGCDWGPVIRVSHVTKPETGLSRLISSQTQHCSLTWL